MARFEIREEMFMCNPPRLSAFCVVDTRSTSSLSRSRIVAVIPCLFGEDQNNESLRLLAQELRDLLNRFAT